MTNDIGFTTPDLPIDDSNKFIKEKLFHELQQAMLGLELPVINDTKYDDTYLRIQLGKLSDEVDYLLSLVPDESLGLEVDDILVGTTIDNIDFVPPLVVEDILVASDVEEADGQMTEYKDLDKLYIFVDTDTAASTSTTRINALSSNSSFISVITEIMPNGYDVEFVQRSDGQFLRMISLEDEETTLAGTSNIAAMAFQATSAYDDWYPNRNSAYDTDLAYCRSRFTDAEEGHFFGRSIWLKNTTGLSPNTDLGDLMRDMYAGVGNYSGTNGLNDYSGVSWWAQTSRSYTEDQYAELIIQLLQAIGYNMYSEY